jgi:DNA mismatch repair ATPase MutL
VNVPTSSNTINSNSSNHNHSHPQQQQHPQQSTHQQQSVPERSPSPTQFHSPAVMFSAPASSPDYSSNKFAQQKEDHTYSNNTPAQPQQQQMTQQTNPQPQPEPEQLQLPASFPTVFNWVHIGAEIMGILIFVILFYVTLRQFMSRHSC